MLHIRTPLILHPTLSTPTRRIWLKLENLQPSGSFKLRGMGLLCSQAAAQGKRKVVCPSGGNAGFATAVAAARLGLKACIVVPNTTPESTRLRISKTGAEVLVHGKIWDEANQRAKELARGTNTEYVPAFDHPVLWEGHSTMIDEILEDCPEVDVVVTSVGGGGLLAGILTGLIRHKRMDCRIVACETEGAASFAAAVEAGRPVRLARISTVATSLGAAQVAAWPVEHIRDFPHECVVLSDDEAIMGVVRYASDLRQLVEPACGVSLAVAYLDHPAIAEAHDVVIIVCGGVSIAAQLVAGWARTSGSTEKRPN
ncbi:pyridoxal-phosphate dependent enzyme [Pseudomonas frederiksbergensis]|uniref:L-serine ammonia-lyase n=1 Tax=Pseudomonas frederiksbergensis TaxID=104087 RepID=A0A6L5C017_9PSED|nr:pyridoxal-phosphate dependent enzyme [Pseudomonas frederiksbergensis]KAF2394356.1 L-threonine dehydratase biosynthetic IlvA [Pseudomonas frederiksbergensis]